jgi:branched-chain amino acid transport system ATP-binding protein/neutral amino acid transport system ATP-binding protein
MSAILAASGLHAGYGAGDILKGIDFALEERKILSLIGPNGSGKSTLVKTLAGLLEARQGEVRFAGERVDGWSPPRRVRSGLAYVPQEYNVFRNLTVLENLRISHEFMGGGAGALLPDDLAALFPDLPSRYGALAGNLSGGQRQMLALACALTVRPKVLMLDEISAGLSPLLSNAIFKTVKSINATGVAVLMVEQNAIEALGISDECIVLAGGRVRFCAPAHDVLGRKDLHSLYLGDAREAAA